MNRQTLSIIAAMTILAIASLDCATTGKLNDTIDRSLTNLSVARSDAYTLARYIKADSTRDADGFRGCGLKYDRARSAVDEYLNRVWKDVERGASTDTTGYGVLAVRAQSHANTFVVAAEKYLGLQQLVDSDDVIAASALVDLAKSLLDNWSDKQKEVLKARIDEARWKPFAEL